MKRVLIALCFFAALVGIWQILYLAKVKSPVLLPSPGDVGRYLV